MNISGIFDKTKSFINKNSSTILTILGIATAGASVVSAVKATPKALDHIDNKKEELDYAPDEKMNAKEIIKVTWKDYIPTVSLFAASATCILCAHKISSKRNAALATAYAVTENSFRRYRNSVIDTIGENKEKEVREKSASKAIDKDNQNSTTNSLIVTSNGNSLCYDVISGRYFTSDIESIKEIINKLNRRLTYENYISLNEYYDEIGLPQIKMGETIGWKLDNGLIEPAFGAILDDKGKAVISIEFLVLPSEDYNKIY